MGATDLVGDGLVQERLADQRFVESLAEKVVEVYGNPNGEIPEHIRPWLSIVDEEEQRIQQRYDDGEFSTDASTTTTVLHRRGQDMATIAVALAVNGEEQAVSRDVIHRVLLHSYTTLHSRADLSIERSVVDGLVEADEASGTLRLVEPRTEVD